MRTALARIEVRPSFCNKCSAGIRQQIEEISEIGNIELYPNDSLITFNFSSACILSNVLNLLSNMGYYEKEENRTPKGFCQC